MTRYAKAALLAATTMTFIPTTGSAQTTCDDKVAAMAALETDYKDEQAALQTEGEAIDKAGGNLSISGTVEMKMTEQRWVFHLPSMTMKIHAMSLDLPQTTMKTRAIIWDNPTIVMRPTKTGQYPRFKCHGFKCTVEWKDIITNLPHTEMRRQSISMNIPEFRMDRTDLSTKIPEFQMKRQEWKINIPEFTLHDVKAEARTLQDRGKKLGESADALTGTIKTKAAEASAGVYACYRTDLSDKRQQVAAQFDGALTQLDGAIVSIRAAGADPTAMQTDAGVLNLVSERQRIESERGEALKQIDDSIKTIDDQQLVATAAIIA